MDKIKVTEFENRSNIQLMAEPIIRQPVKRRHVSTLPIVTSHKVKAEFVTDAPKEKTLRDGWLFVGSLLCLGTGGFLGILVIILKLAQ